MYDCACACTLNAILLVLESCTADKSSPANWSRFKFYKRIRKDFKSISKDSLTNFWHPSLDPNMDIRIP